MKPFRIALLLLLPVVTGLLLAFSYGGTYALNVLYRRGGTYWVTVPPDSARLSPSMRVALSSNERPRSGPVHWRTIAPGFETAEVRVTVKDSTVDRIRLARIDAARFRFEVLNAPAGDRDLDDWMIQTHAALVVNGSYFGHDGKPDTPFLSKGVMMGPQSYQARAGAFVAGPGYAGVTNLSNLEWRAAFRGADNAMVSYPLLLADGKTHVKAKSRWLANRSFVAEDHHGRILIGTTAEAYFTLDRLAEFLKDAPLDLKTALNLDGGPVANLGIHINGYTSKTYGHWETQVKDDKVHLLSWPYGTFAMPVVLAVFPK